MKKDSAELELEALMVRAIRGAIRELAARRARLLRAAEKIEKLEVFNKELLKTNQDLARMINKKAR